MDKGLFKMFAFLAILIVVGVAATAIMVASQKATAPTNGSVATNGNGGTTEA